MDQEEEAYLCFSTHLLNAKTGIVQGSRTTRSAGNSPDIMPIASNSKRILRSSKNLSLCTVYSNQGITRQSVQSDVETLVHALESDDKDPTSKPVQEQNLAPAPPKYSSKLLNTV